MKGWVNVMKKAVGLFAALVVSLSLFMLIPSALAVSDASEIKVVLNGETLSFDIPPQIINGRIVVPLRAIFEAMGASVEWNADTQTVTAIKGATVVALKIGDCFPTINDIIVEIDQPGIVERGRTLAPLRFVSEAFGGSVKWGSEDNIVTINNLNQVDVSDIAATEPPDTLVLPEPEIIEYVKGTVTSSSFASEYLNLSFTASSNIGFANENDLYSLNQRGTEVMQFLLDETVVANTIAEVTLEMFAQGPNRPFPLIKVW